MRYLFILFVLGFNFSDFSQNNFCSFKNQQWGQYYNEIHFQNKLSILSDVGFRTKSSFNEYAQYISRVGLAYQMYPDVRYAVGFAHLGFYNNNELNKLEFRTYQEVLWQQNAKKLNLTYRIRVEERFFQGLEEHRFNGASSFNLRFRYYVKMGIPLFHFKANNYIENISFQLGNELFLNAGKQVQNQIFDQNRVILGPNFQFSKNLSCNLNYNFQFSNNRSAKETCVTQVFWLGIKHQIHYVKKHERTAY
jgi:hypothetical protein